MKQLCQREGVTNKNESPGLSDFRAQAFVPNHAVLLMAVGKERLFQPLKQPTGANSPITQIIQTAF